MSVVTNRRNDGNGGNDRNGNDSYHDDLEALNELRAEIKVLEWILK